MEDAKGVIRMMAYMGAIWDLISSNALISGIVVIAIGWVGNKIWKWRGDQRDSKTIYDFLLTSKTDVDFTFRSTEAISSHTKIPEKRVADLCSRHPKIRRNEKQKQSWTLDA